MTARIYMKIDGIGGCSSARPALTMGETGSLEYLATQVPEDGVVKEGIGEIAEEFVIANYGQSAYEVDLPTTTPFVMENWMFRRLVVQAKRAMLDIVNDIRDGGPYPQIPTEESDNPRYEHEYIEA